LVRKERGRLIQWSAVRCSPGDDEEWKNAAVAQFTTTLSNFAVAATDVGPSGDSGNPHGCFEQNFEQAQRISLLTNVLALPAGFSARVPNIAPP